MFEQVPRTTPFLTADAEAFFAGKVEGDSPRGDTVFMSTLRALMAPKLGREDFTPIRAVFTAAYTAYGDSDTDLCGAAVSQVNLTARNTLYVVSIGKDRERSGKMLDAVSRVLPARASGWEEARKFREYFNRGQKICGAYFHNVENRTGILFIDRISTPRLQVISQLIPSMLPWYFPDQASVTEQGMELLKALSEPEPDHWMEVLQKMTAAIDFRTDRIRSLLSDFEVNGDKNALQSLERNQEDLRKQIEDHRRAISDIYESIRDQETRILGLRQRIEDGNTGDTPLVQFFIRSKNVELVSARGNTLCYRVSATIGGPRGAGGGCYEKSAAEGVIENLRSVVYGGVQRDKREALQRVLRGIFLLEKYRLRMVGTFRLRICGTLNAESGEDYPAGYETMLPNPHLFHYGCTGSFQDGFDAYMERGNYRAAVSASCVAAGSLNWNDGSVMGMFGPDMVSDWNRQILEKPDGTLISPKDAAEEMENEEKEGK